MCCAWVGILPVCAEKHLLRHKADQEAHNFIYIRFRGWAQEENNPYFTLKSVLPHTAQRPREGDQRGCKKEETILKAQSSSEMCPGNPCCSFLYQLRHSRPNSRHSQLQRVFDNFPFWKIHLLPGVVWFVLPSSHMKILPLEFNKQFLVKSIHP